MCRFSFIALSYLPSRQYGSGWMCSAWPAVWFAVSMGLSTFTSSDTFFLAEYLWSAMAKAWVNYIMWLKQCHEQPIRESFLPTKNGDFGMVGMAFFYPPWFAVSKNSNHKKIQAVQECKKDARQALRDTCKQSLKAGFDGCFTEKNTIRNGGCTSEWGVNHQKLWI